MKLYSKHQVWAFVVAAVIITTGAFASTLYIKKIMAGNESVPAVTAESAGILPESNFELQESFVPFTAALDSGDYTQDELQNISVYENCNEAVVNITTQTMGINWFLEPVPQEGASGSGSIIDKRGYVLTNTHVIEDAYKIYISLYDGTQYEGTVIGTDYESDLAVIKFEPPAGMEVRTIPFGDSDSLKVGQKVLAIGNPFGLERTLTTGIVSGLGRPILSSSNNIIKDMIQTDTAINPGNSGGGLFDGEGNLIGIVVAKSSGSNVEGLGFAIPINTAAEIGKELIENGHVTGRAALGVSVIDASDAQTAMQYGLQLTGIYIAEVTGSEAKAAGFERGDMIYYIDDTQIDSSATLSSVLLDHKPGDKVKVIVIRDGKTVELTTTLTEAQ